METGIRAEDVSLRALLKAEETLYIPPYQRSYSWLENDAIALYQDLLEACDSDMPHFVGAIVTIEPDKTTRSEIVDGQQRLTTLTMMLAILRDLTENSELRNSLHSLISPPGKKGFFQRSRAEDGWKLILNEIDAPFFEAAIQEQGATSRPPAISAQTESQVRILDNVAVLQEEISSLSSADIEKLARFISDGCAMVRVHVMNRDAGYRVFRILNTRGRAPNAHDVLKTELFERANVQRDEADALSKRWTEYEARLGATKFDDLLRQIRAMHDRSGKGDIVTGYRRAVFETIPPHDFLKTELPAYVDAYHDLMTAHPFLERHAHDVANHINRLHTLEHNGWRAPALKFMREGPDDADATREFFCDLERLGFALQFIVTDRDARARRYRRVVDDIKDIERLFATDGALSLSAEEREKLAQRLKGRFGSFGQRRALALKLNSILEGGEKLKPDSDATVEHILPRNPSAGSDWLKDWPDLPVRRDLCDTLGNLCLLTTKDNQRADRLNFQDKRQIFFGSDPASNKFALTRDVFEYDVWTPETVRFRTSKLANMLIRDWKLDLPEG